ncbi:hypothetical protein TGS27_0851 [Geobacillus stearothermophilus]|uniref:Uncharacterized protein n=1 Tax=Geobacillus stearothermophilus TaxID=1422 RepID=A0A150MP46_GEOSE|nr:hypothetical protein GS8_1130 [Geobacillus stearothermophilus]KYD26250.1 hypothetical protein B4109_1423 [Geobacillus stearothermophilus]OAO84692.1 hypothetical protein TGS27_0851 [Geobacillus stearothermophilus]
MCLTFHCEAGMMEKASFVRCGIATAVPLACECSRHGIFVAAIY